MLFINDNQQMMLMHNLYVTYFAIIMYGLGYNV